MLPAARRCGPGAAHRTLPAVLSGFGPPSRCRLPRHFHQPSDFPSGRRLWFLSIKVKERKPPSGGLRRSRPVPSRPRSPRPHRRAPPLRPLRPHGFLPRPGPGSAGAAGSAPRPRCPCPGFTRQRGLFVSPLVSEGCLKNSSHSALLISDFCPLVTGLGSSCK